MKVTDDGVHQGVVVDIMAEGKRVKRRRHDAQLKASVVALCAQSGASVAQIALEHGLNANLVHRWRRIAEGREVRHKGDVAAQFVSLPLQPATPHAAAEVIHIEVIHIEVRRAEAAIRIDWPTSKAVQCGQWLASLLR